MSDREFVSVIIPVFRDWEKLRSCLKALKEQTYGSDNFEIIVVNNDPDDELPNLQFDDNVIIAEEVKAGSYAARNRGIFLAKGNIIAFTDADCVPDADWILNATKYISIGFDRVAGHVELFYKEPRLSIAEKFEKAYAFPQKKNADMGASVTANMITHKESFNIVGGFNDSMLSGGDFEWSRRAQEKGLSIVYAAGVIVKHPARHSVRELLKKRKRVAGGSNEAGFGSGDHSWLWRGFMPPLAGYLTIRDRRDLSRNEKVVAFSVLYLLKVYGTMHKIFLLLRIKTRQRS